MLIKHLVSILQRFGILLFLYFILRLTFFFYHFDLYRGVSGLELMEGFILGMRFDLAALCLLNLPSIVVSLVPRLARVERFFFVVLNTAAVLVSLIDLELFSFVGKRMSLDLFVISEDILKQLPQLAIYYWYFTFIALGIGWAFYKVCKRIPIELKSVKITQKIFYAFGLLLVMAVFVRGGLQHKSISIQSAFTQGKNELGHLVLNTPYHFLRTLKNIPLKRVSFFKSDEEAKKIILDSRNPNSKTLKKKYNVVLLVLESVSLEYFEEGYAPFLKKLQNESLFFGKHFANGRRSIEALPALLCGLPSLLDEPISKSAFQANKFICMPPLLKEQGYTNVFFHGGAKGTMGFEAYTLANGFDRYYSKDDYTEKKDFDGTWGIFDGPYLKFAAKEISQLHEPFLAGIFTLSSHQPYSLPSEKKNKYPKGTLEIHESIGYVDESLKEFFEEVKKEKWFEKTVFIITADHTQKSDHKKFQNFVGNFRVPLIIYGAGLTGEKNKITQHADIPNTILDLVGAENEVGLGVSVLAEDSGAALFYTDGQYVMVRENKVTTLEKAFDYDWQTGELKPRESTGDEPLLKAYVQFFVNGLINNNLSLYR